MIIPIGHEQSGLRRLPWVTFAIMVLCIAAFLLTGRGAPGATEAENERAEELVQYYSDHPYLELDKRVEERLFQGMSEQKKAALLEGLRSMAHPPASPAARQMEQQELDRLTQVVLDAVASDPLIAWGLVPAHPSLATFFTHMFLHSGWLHLLGNLFILYLSGPYIEDVWGRPLYTSFYLVSGLVAALAFMLRHPDLQTPLVGASGAISGVMGAFLVRYWHTKIRFFYWLGLVWRGTFDAPAWLMLTLWFIQQIFFAALDDAGAGSGVAYLAHAGGFVFGAGAALVIHRLDVEGRFIRDKIEAKVTTVHVNKPVLDRALTMHAAGNTAQAFEMLLAEAARTPDDRDVVLALWDMAVEEGHSTKVAPMMERVIRQEIRGGEGDLAAEHWLDLTRHVPGLDLGPAAMFRLGQALAHKGERREAVQTLRAAISSNGSAIEPALALRIARAAKDLDMELARAAARLALARPGLEPSDRQVAERLATQGEISTGEIPSGEIST